jgi:two-component system cell cycle sensor histidine kinase/response regulator CckA
MTKAQLLIVEDDNIIAMELADRLKNLEYGVCAKVPSGKEAIAQTDELRPDLVLMDIRLKGAMDGVDAAAEIRKQFDIPVIYLTAYADANTLERAKITEPYGYIIKPFEEKELHTTIEMALYKHQMEKKLRERERWLTTTLQSIGDAVIATNEMGLISLMNPMAESLTGWKQEEALGSWITEVFIVKHVEADSAAASPIKEAIREGEITDLANHILLTKNETEIPIEGNTAIVKDDRGNVNGIVLVFRDASRHKHT